MYFKHKTHTVHWQSTFLSCGSFLEVSYRINVFVRSILSLHLLHKIEVPKVGADITGRRAGQVGGVSPWLHNRGSLTTVKHVTSRILSRVRRTESSPKEPTTNFSVLCLGELPYSKGPQVLQGLWGSYLYQWPQLTTMLLG